MVMGCPIAKQIVTARRPCRRVLLMGLAACVLLGCRARRESAAPAPARIKQSPEQLEREVYGRVNAYRQSRGLPALAMDRKMRALAREHSRWMARRTNLTHRGSGARFRRLQGDPTSLVSFAENVAYNLGHANPARVAVDGWLRSPGHHQNIMRRDDQLTGVGVAQARDGSWYFTQLHGRRR